MLLIEYTYINADAYSRPNAIMRDQHQLTRDDVTNDDVNECDKQCCSVSISCGVIPRGKVSQNKSCVRLIRC